jgi:parallel beta-helix repeat protein
MANRKAEILTSMQAGEFNGEEILEDITRHEVAMDRLAWMVQYGSTGKTILSYPGSDDNARMMNMLADVGSIILPDGYVALVDPIVITTLKCVITTQGGWATIKLKDNSNDDLIRFVGTGSGGGYFGASQIYFDGNMANQTSSIDSAVIRLRNASYSIISRCAVWSGFGDGICIENKDKSGDADELNIENCFIFGNGRNGINLTYSGTQPTVQYPGDHLIIGNHINYNKANGIYCSAGYATLILGNNILTNDIYGIKLEYCSRFVVSENQVRYNGGDGLFANHFASSQVTNNQFHLNTRDGGGVQADIWNCSDTVISGNHCNDADFTPNCDYGMQFDTCYSLSITGNVFRGVIDGVVMNNVTYKASGNQGLADRGEREISIYCVEGDTACEIKDGVGYFPVPESLNGLNISDVTASVVTAGTTGTMDIQISRRRSGSWVDVLSTKLTIDSTEEDSSTAAVPAVINASNDDVLIYDLLRVDVDAIHTTPAEGLCVNLRFR